MLYHATPDAIPARLSHAQYESYSQEFEAFAAKCRRSIIWTVILFFLGAIALLAAVVYFFGFETLELIMDDRYEFQFGAVFMTLWCLPFVIKFWQGYKLYNKPTNELELLPEGVAMPLTASQKQDRRILGMSDELLGLMVIVPIIGITVELITDMPKTLEDCNLIAFYCLCRAFKVAILLSYDTIES